MLCVRGAHAFDGDAMLDRPTVLLEGDRIVAAGVEPPSDAEVVDLGDVTLLPGLVDTHLHLCFDGMGTFEEQVVGVSDDDLVARARANGRLALQAGITTIRDLGDRDYLTLPLRADDDLPTLLCAGPPITRPQGHCWFLGGEAQGEAGLRQAARERDERGCDVVKVMVTGGAGTPTYPMWRSQFSLDELRAVVDEAHAAGLPVAAHCHGSDGIEQALAVGVDSIEHCTFFVEGDRATVDEDLIARVAASGIVVSSTLGRLPTGPIGHPVIAANMEAMIASRRRLHDLGAAMVVGTDAGIAPIKPHDVLPHAYGELVAIGMGHLEALRSLTSMAATTCRVGDRKGRLRSGWDADLLAVRGDATVDTAALLEPVAVWHRGKRVR